MLSATDFLPARMIEFMNFETTMFPYFGSGLISRFSALWRRDIGSSSVFSIPLAGKSGRGLFLGFVGPHAAVPRSWHLRKTTQSLGSFCSVFGAPLLAVLHALGVEDAAQNVVANARQVFHAAATDHHHRVLLQIVALAGDVTDHLEAVGEPHLRDLAQGGI